MKIAFRLDATMEIGIGHFMRCIVLATELQTQGAEVCFIGSEYPAYLNEMLNQAGIKFHSLGKYNLSDVLCVVGNKTWPRKLQMQDAVSTNLILSDQVWDWIVCDHYSLDHTWEKGVRSRAKKIMVIDDLANRIHDCDILLDQNYYVNMNTRYVGKVPNTCRTLLGPRYALLRNDFKNSRREVRVRAGHVKKILISFGGMDANNYSKIAIDAVSRIKDIDSVDVVIGGQHAHAEEILNVCNTLGYMCHINTVNIANLMAKADLAIGGGGITTWERCCIGLPSISICTAANQLEQISDAAGIGLVYAPLIKGELSDSIYRHTCALMDNPALLKLISARGMNMVDGGGVSRVAGVMNSINIHVRPADMGDSNNIFKWRNHESIRSISRNSKKISKKQHEEWFKSVLESNKHDLLICMCGVDSIGVVRFDIEENAAEISIYLIPDKKLTGFGGGLLMAAENWIAENRPDLTEISACAYDQNQASRNLFIHSGYSIRKIYFHKKVNLWEKN